MLNTTERFWAKVDRDGPVPEFDPSLGPCWLWTAAVGTHGYGAFRDASGTTTTAHRWIYEHVVGPIPEGEQVDHLCRVKTCVNPSHLEAVTRKENVQRGARGRLVTHCPQGHELAGENVYLRKNGWRMCLSCSRSRALLRARRRISVQQVEKYVGKQRRKAS